MPRFLTVLRVQELRLRNLSGFALASASHRQQTRGGGTEQANRTGFRNSDCRREPRVGCRSSADGADKCRGAGGGVNRIKLIGAAGQNRGVRERVVCTGNIESNARVKA